MGDSSAFEAFLSQASDVVWGPILIPLLAATGIYLTLRLRGLQFRELGRSLWLALVVRKEEGAEGDISHFQALMTALAATVGTGNIAGVATAIAAGGPGALFWMWMTGLVGMATKYSEALLSVRYRTIDERGHVAGGPMYFLALGLPRRGGRWLGAAYAFFAAIAAFGIGNGVQSAEVGRALEATFGWNPLRVQILLALAVGAVILGGIRMLGRVSAVLVPVMIVFYVAAALVILVLNAAEIPVALSAVFRGAFGAEALGGGLAGAGVRGALRFGVARGIFSNESGLGSAGIAAAAAQTREPVRQALVSMTQTFIDTMVICTLTGLVILTTVARDAERAESADALPLAEVVERLAPAVEDGRLDLAAPDLSERADELAPGTGSAARLARWRLVSGSESTALAFREGLPGGFGGAVVSIGLALFAFSTILGWSYYGEKSVEYLLGVRAVMPYRLLFAAMVVGGPAWLGTTAVWTFSDVMNGLMAIPNLIGLLLLSGVVAAETRAWLAAQEEAE